MVTYWFCGILDVPGFVNLSINSLEQFCINFINEKLQQFFNNRIIESQQKQYINQSVLWEPLNIKDNSQYINMVEDTSWGVFSILETVYSSTQQFKDRLFKTHGKNPTLSICNKPGATSSYFVTKNSHQVFIFF